MVYKKSLRKSSKRKRSKSKRKSIGKCRKYLQKKIAINMGEYKKGRFVSPAQAIAVSYSETLKKFPMCKRHLSRKNNEEIKETIIEFGF